jgi:hypothetical protein
MPIQSSGLVLRASESRNAVSSEMPALPFKMRESAACFNTRWVRNLEAQS